MTSTDLDFIRLVVDGDIERVTRCLAASPALAAMSSHVGASRQESSTFFFADIAHYFYAGDTALHMAAAAFRRHVAALLVAQGADCRAKNRRGAEPLHYAADANRWDPTAQAETIEYLIDPCLGKRALADTQMEPTRAGS
jgi:ankyrin repeat protein